MENDWVHSILFLLNMVSVVSLFFFSTGWKYNGFHAALWERDLISVEQHGPITLHSISSLKVQNPRNVIHLQKEISGHATHRTHANINWQTLLYFQSNSSMQRNMQDPPNHMKKKSFFAWTFCYWYMKEIWKTSSLPD